jgi:ribosome modulation factor
MEAKSRARQSKVSIRCFLRFAKTECCLPAHGWAATAVPSRALQRGPRTGLESRSRQACPRGRRGLPATSNTVVKGSWGGGGAVVKGSRPHHGKATLPERRDHGR